MLPISTAQPQAYAAKMLRFRHMDFEYALWLMANLCISPRTAFRSTLYHSRTKHQWARDDPAFLIILLYLLIVATVAWSLAFAQRTPLQVVGLMLYVVTVDFLLLGAAVATVSWWLANTYLHERARAPTDWGAVADAESSETVEWFYAFDVHCNAFLPVYLALYGLQYVLLPLLLHSGFVAAALSSALYALAFSAYHYLTFLGYSELPFLHRCECFVYPIALIGIGFVLSLPFKFNPTAVVAYIYFG